ncbi:hemolysin III family protein [Saccharopolyspora cebuensis]|uniref:Hemolysin III family protein n=1 Tax=Saccharopolyspora cebuensis TaxID=418759 RepID=A0ABV4CG06_9PSEU
MFGVSAVYHLITWRSERARTWMRRLDHSMIFLLIAGTDTPIGLLALPQDTARIVLGVAWAGTLGGMLLKLSWPHAPRWVGVPLYIALGWVAVFVLDDLLRTAGVAGLVLLPAGGVLYTAGAISYATRWPDPLPSTFATTRSSTPPSPQRRSATTSPSGSSYPSHPPPRDAASRPPALPPGSSGGLSRGVDEVSPARRSSGFGARLRAGTGLDRIRAVRRDPKDRQQRDHEHLALIDAR